MVNYVVDVLVDLSKAVELLQNTVEEPQILKLTSVRNLKYVMYSTLHTAIHLVRYKTQILTASILYSRLPNKPNCHLYANLIF